MTSTAQNIYWAQRAPYTKTRDPWDKPQVYQSLYKKSSFIMLKRSRKGTHLNIPEEFYSTTPKKSYIGRIPVLPNGKCCDQDYVLFRQNAYNENISRHNQMYQNTVPHYTPSVTINIGASTPFTQIYPGYQQKISYSTISINPSVASEEPWVTKKNVIPLGLHCCDKIHTGPCEKAQSKEERVVNYETMEKDTHSEKYVYVQNVPTISPLKSCWEFLTCKRKKRHEDRYLPSVLTKNEPKHECTVCPKTSKTSNRWNKINDQNKNLLLHPSKLSTITESEITISEYSSEEFNPQGVKEMKGKQVKQSERTYIGGTKLEDLTTYSQSAIMYTTPTSQDDGKIYRWVCEPAGDKNGTVVNGRRQYFCYRESLT